MDLFNIRSADGKYDINVINVMNRNSPGLTSYFNSYFTSYFTSFIFSLLIILKQLFVAEFRCNLKQKYFMSVESSG